MRKPRLPAERVAALLAYDPITGVLTWRYREDVAKQINTRFAGRTAGTRKRGEIQVCIQHNGKQRLYRGHHLAWAIMTGSWPAQDVDHRDANPWNNAWSNLRLASPSDNRCNIPRVRGASGLRGVFFVKGCVRPYLAKIARHGKQIVIGRFSNPQDAARAYDRAALKHHGEFAVTNEQLGLLEAVDA